MDTTPPAETVRTCQNCARAKIRCLRTVGAGAGAPCDRCRRLRKDCVFRPSRRRFGGASAAPPQPLPPQPPLSFIDAGASTTASNGGNEVAPRQNQHQLAAIEAKLDRLLSLHGGSSGQTPSSTSTGASSSSHPGSAAAVDATVFPGDVIDDGVLSLQQAERCVRIYREELTPHFPFVVVDCESEVEVQRLRRERPVLFLAVVGAASFEDVGVQRECARRLREVVADEVAGRTKPGEHGGKVMGVELLLGLLVGLAWSHYHPKPRRYSQHLHIAISIIADQRLDRPRRAQPWKTHVGSTLHEPIPETQPPPPSREQSNEIKRAVAGCYYLSSSVATLMQKLSTFPCTAYIEDCCKFLSENPEYPTDTYLHAIICLQRSIEELDTYLLADPPTAARPNNPAWMQFAIPRTNSRSIETKLPFDLRENELVYMLYHTAELNAVHLRLFFSGMNQGTCLNAEDLNNGFRVASSLLGFHLSLPPRRDLTFNNSEWLQLSLALTISAKLVFAALHPSLRMNRGVPASLDLSGLLRQIMQRLGTLQRSTVEPVDQPYVFNDFAQRVQRLQKWFENRYARVQGAAQAVQEPPGSGPGETVNFSQFAGSEMLLPDFLAFDGLATLDLQLAALFPDMQMGDAMGDWPMGPDAF